MNQTEGSWYKGKHLGMIFVIIAFYFLFTILVAGSTNTVFPKLSEMNGWDNGKILIALTFSGYIGAFSIMFMSKLVMKWGAKLIATICVGATACLVAGWGMITNLTVFIFLLLLLRVFITGFQAAAGPALSSAWFPRTKGIMLGFATMGIPLCDIIWSPYIPKALERFGAKYTFWFVAFCYAVFCLIIILFVKNTPEEAGTFPDGIKAGVENATRTKAQQKEYVSPWTVSKVLSTKEVWLIIFGWGFLWMSASLFLNQIVPRVISLGYSSDFAVHILQVSAVAAVIGSFVFGVVDQKFNPQKASQILAGWLIIMYTFALLMDKNVLFVWIAPVGVMTGVGAICNLIPSVMISMWGRYDFIAVNRVVSCAHLLITSSAFAVIAFLLSTKAGFVGLHALSLILSIVSLILISVLKFQKLGK